MEQESIKLEESLISIASELFRFQRVFEKAINKLGIDERNKYFSQFSWFEKRIIKALSDAGLSLVNLEGQMYDPGMAVTPLNIDEFDVQDQLFVLQTIEPIVMQDGIVRKSGTVLLGSVKQ